jgi:hypothetical protein
MQHPKKALLNSNEFDMRAIGSMFLPYIGDGGSHPVDEVWGIAKIYDADAIEVLETEPMSTSPGVLLGGSSAGDYKVMMEDGKPLLVEGKPALLDHIAICELGVWDKGGEPEGVNSIAVGDDNMVDKTRADELLEKCLEHIQGMGQKVDSMGARVDAIARRHDDDDARKRFSRRKDDDDDDAYRKRHDAEEEEVKKSFKEKGDPEDVAADRSKRARKDAEEEELFIKDRRHKKDDDDGDDKKHDARDDDFSKRKDDDDDDTYKKRHDSEEEEMVKAGAKKEDVRRARKDAEKRDDDVRRKKDDDDDVKKKADAAANLAGTTAEQVLAMQKSFTAKIAELTAMIPPQTTDENFNSLIDAQARADGFYSQHGLQAPRPLNGETVIGYRRRALRGLQQHSLRWKDTDLLKLDDTTFGVIEEQVYADSVIAANNPVDLADGVLRPIVRRLASGHTVTEYRGSPRAWMDKFAGPVRQYVKKFTDRGAA